MINITRMDWYRIIHSKSTYICLSFLVLMAFALPLTIDGVNVEMMLGASDGSQDFLMGSMGTNVVLILLGIILSIFISHDYSNGFSHNIFSVHANRLDYIGGKICAFSILSACMIVFYTLLSFLFMIVFAGEIVLSGGLSGLIVFLLLKWILSIAFISLILLLNVITRSSAFGIIAGFLITTGGLEMGLQIFGGSLFKFIDEIIIYFIAGASSSISLSIQLESIRTVLIAGILWTGGSILLSKVVLDRKDVC